MKEDRLGHHFFAVIGASGSGKTKVTEAVFPKEYKVISHTTRPMREGEASGVDYYFETEESFDALITSDSLVEHDVYNGYRYGVGVNDLLKATKNHLAYDAITIDGFWSIKERFGDQVIPILLEVSKEMALSRLLERESDQRVIKNRMALFEDEIKERDKIKACPTSRCIDANQPIEKVIAEMKKIVEEYSNNGLEK